jgi:hypothetical protein
MPAAAERSRRVPLALAEAGLGDSVIDGYERGVFALMLVIGCVFEAAWHITRGTNAMT